MARKTDNQRQKIVAIRLYDYEVKAIDAAAAKKNLSRSDFIRRSVRAHYKAILGKEK